MFIPRVVRYKMVPGKKLFEKYFKIHNLDFKKQFSMRITWRIFFECNKLVHVTLRLMLSWVTMGYFTTIEIYCVLDPTMTVTSLICVSVKFYPNSKPFYVGIEVDIQYAICFNRWVMTDSTTFQPHVESKISMKIVKVYFDNHLYW